MSKKFRETHLFAFLNRMDLRHQPLDSAFSDYLRTHKSIGAHDRRWIGDTAYSLVRHQGILDYILRKNASWEERHHLLEKIDFSHLPPHLPLWVQSGGSEWLFSELAKSYGEKQASELCKILNEPAPLTVRVNLLKVSREELLSRWEKWGAEPCTKSSAGIRFPERIALTSLPEFKEGLFEIQDEGSQLIADLVQPKVGEQMLDFCSGSGGKSLSIATRMGGRGQIYLHDIRPHILVQAKKRLRRAGIQNAQFLTPDHPRLSSLKNKIDWVLADVPCSGSGTLRRNPDMKWKLNREIVDRLVLEQRKIFTEALAYVRPGKNIVYATCSIFEKENQAQVEYFLKHLPVELAAPPLSLFPITNGPDGFFGALFSKKS